MKILHTSDLHADLMEKLHNKTHLIGAFDVWVDTGDFFPNFPLIKKKNGHSSEEIIDKRTEKKRQAEWLKEKKILEHMTKWLNGRPFVSVQGNHDFISLVDALHKFGYENAYEISPEGFELEGFKWAGFPNIPYIGGEWNHETLPCEFDELMERIHKSQPELLIIHCPPKGILDLVKRYAKTGQVRRANYGIGHFTNYFSYKPHRISHVLCGHIHEQGGMKKNHEDLGVCFINGARHCVLHTI